MEVIENVLPKTARKDQYTDMDYLLQDLEPHTNHQADKIHPFRDRERGRGRGGGEDVWLITFRRLLKSLPYLGKQPFESCFLVIQFCVCSSSSGSMKIKGRA